MSNEYIPARETLIGAALAIRRNCRRRPVHCDTCAFYEKDADPHCLLNIQPPSEWRMPGEPRRASVFDDHEVSGLLDD